MKRFPSFLVGAAVVLSVVSCSKSNESDLTQNTGSNGGNSPACDTVNMKFTTNVKPILEANCYACHSNANFSISGVRLEEHADLKRQADNGNLLGAISHAAGYPPMPQGGPKLSDCNINKIRAWVNRGAQNN